MLGIKRRFDQFDPNFQCIFTCDRNDQNLAKIGKSLTRTIIFEPNFNFWAALVLSPLICFLTHTSPHSKRGLMSDGIWIFTKTLTGVNKGLSQTIFGFITFFEVSCNIFRLCCLKLDPFSDYYRTMFN